MNIHKMLPPTPISVLKAYFNITMFLQLEKAPGLSKRAHAPCELIADYKGDFFLCLIMRMTFNFYSD